MKRGFTLIELLVVLAIIGILSSVVLASLSAARKRGQERASEPFKSEQQLEREKCESRGQWMSVSDLPAACLKYFGVDPNVAASAKGR